MHLALISRLVSVKVQRERDPSGVMKQIETQERGGLTKFGREGVCRRSSCGICASGVELHFRQNER